MGGSYPNKYSLKFLPFWNTNQAVCRSHGCNPAFPGSLLLNKNFQRNCSIAFNLNNIKNEEAMSDSFCENSSRRYYVSILTAHEIPKVTVCIHHVCGESQPELGADI